MKKLTQILLIGIMAMLFIPTVQAQALSTPLVSRYAKVLDTVTNTGSKSMTTKLRVTGTGESVTVSTYNVNLTGTMSGVARLFGSNDGVHYARVRSASLRGAQVDSLLIGPSTLTYNWIVDRNPLQYYQVQTTGIGTVTFTVAGQAYKH